MAAETCSREAIVNHQRVLVDTNSTQKGEGLRYFLKDDKKALSYLDQYQKNSQIEWHDAIIGSTGLGLILATGFINTSSDTKNSMVLSGVAMLALNFLVAKTISRNNESNLERAIQEYNKRNIPRINFKPVSYRGKTRPEFSISFNKVF